MRMIPRAVSGEGAGALLSKAVRDAVVYLVAASYDAGKLTLEEKWDLVFMAALRVTSAAIGLKADRMTLPHLPQLQSGR